MGKTKSMRFVSFLSSPCVLSDADVYPFPQRVRENVDEVEEALDVELSKARKLLKCDAEFKHMGTKDIFQVRLLPSPSSPNALLTSSYLRDRSKSPSRRKLLASGSRCRARSRSTATIRRRRRD